MLGCQIKNYYLYTYIINMHIDITVRYARDQLSKTTYLVIILLIGKNQWAISLFPFDFLLCDSLYFM